MTIEQALQLLKEKGYKYTGKREEMIRLFDKEKRYLSAKELLELMQTEYPNVSFDTIYRNLTLFEGMGILEATEFGGERKFRIRCQTANHHHHVICLACGTTKHVKACPMDVMFEEPEDFKITGHKFEVYGYCANCHEQDPITAK